LTVGKLAADIEVQARNVYILAYKRLFHINLFQSMIYSIFILLTSK